MQSSIQRIGVIGLGHMGSDFAGNLIADGYQVTVYDRDVKHAAPLVAKGATAAAAISRGARPHHRRMASEGSVLPAIRVFACLSSTGPMRIVSLPTRLKPR
jgi:3-hydroxyacyl-CoA dehydrogenase